MPYGGTVKTVPYGIIKTSHRVVENDALHRFAVNCSSEASILVFIVSVISTFRHEVGFVPYGIT